MLGIIHKICALSRGLQMQVQTLGSKTLQIIWNLWCDHNRHRQRYGEEIRASKDKRGYL